MTTTKTGHRSIREHVDLAVRAEATPRRRVTTSRNVGPHPSGAAITNAPDPTYSEQYGRKAPPGSRRRAAWRSLANRVGLLAVHLFVP
jgi:hypothetical protein